MAELIDLNNEFHLGNKFTLDVASKFSEMLDDKYRSEERRVGKECRCRLARCH